MRKNKIYNVEIVSSAKAYDEKNLFKNIFESLYSIAGQKQFDTCFANPTLINLNAFCYMEIFISARDKTRRKTLNYTSEKSTAVSGVSDLLIAHYAQMISGKESIFTA